MKNDDFLETIEQHRQEIYVDESNNSRRSRMDLHRNGRKSKSKTKSKSNRKANALVTSVFCIFILIPVSILVYVLAFYEPSDVVESAETGDFTIETKDPNKETDIVLDEENDDSDETEKTDSIGYEKVDEGVKSETNTDTPITNEENPSSEDTTNDETGETGSNSVGEQAHTVASGETLYRIAVNFYGDSNATIGIDKIKTANGLSSDEISAGQTLIIPQ